MASIEHQIDAFIQDLRASLSAQTLTSSESLGHVIDTCVMEPIRQELEVVGGQLDTVRDGYLSKFDERAREIQEEYEKNTAVLNKAIQDLTDRNETSRAKVNVIKKHLETKNQGVKMDEDFIPRMDTLLEDIEKYQATLEEVMKTHCKVYLTNMRKRGMWDYIFDVLNLTPFRYDNMEMVLEGEDEQTRKLQIKDLDGLNEVLQPTGSFMYVLKTGELLLTPGKRFRMTIYNNGEPISQTMDVPDY